MNDESRRAGWAGWRGLVPAAGLVLVVLALRLAYLAWLCPYDLVEDEAQYWLWSTRLDWSYYSKGPGVAWAIWLATSVLGSAEWAVRTPAAVAGAIGAMAVAGLAHDAAAWGRGVREIETEHGARLTSEQVSRGTRAGASPAVVGVFAAMAFMLAPALQMVGVLMTIDGPYVACWAVAAWAAFRGVMHGSGRAWGVVGLAVAVGFLFKYTMLLIVPGIVLFAVLARRGGLAPAWGVGVRRWMGVGCAIALLGLAPVAVWNAQNDWATVKHLLGHLGMAGGDMPVGGAGEDRAWSPWWLPELVAMQVGMIGPLLVLGVMAGWRAAAARRRGERDGRWPGVLLMLCAAGPILGMYALVALVTEPEGNWPMAGHVTLLALAGWWAAEGWAGGRKGSRDRGIEGSGEQGMKAEPTPNPLPRGGGFETAGTSARGLKWRGRGWWRMGVVYGVVAMVLLHRADVVAAGVNWLNGVGVFRAGFAWVVGREPREVVVGRLMGAREMAGGVGALLDGLAARDGREGFVVAQHYGRACQVAYYLRERRPPVRILSAMRQTGGRRSQLDVWPDTSMGRAQPELMGGSAVILGNTKPYVVGLFERAFERVELGPQGGRLAGEHKDDRRVYLGYGYRWTGGEE